MARTFTDYSYKRTYAFPEYKAQIEELNKATINLLGVQDKEIQAIAYFKCQSYLD
jgi:hypothetical protein